MRFSRAELRRLSREACRRGELFRRERDSFLGNQLEPGESIVARSRDHPIITDRRILWAKQLIAPPRGGQWVFEALSFAQITGYALGRRHDQRPLIRLEHRSIERIEHLPVHRFLWFEWGNVEGPVPHDTTILGFGKDSDPVFVALRDALERAAITQLEPFVVLPEGTRQERTAYTIAPLKRQTCWIQVRFRLREAMDDLYRGRLSWRVRIPSWLILAVPAWFIDPWLVLPAIVLAEVGWIAALQWSWRRDQLRAGRGPST
jgi:hypothetical protein